MDVTHLQRRTMHKVKVTEAHLRAADIEAQLTRPQARHDRETDWMPATTCKHFPLLPIDDLPEPDVIPVKKNEGLPNLADPKEPSAPPKMHPHPQILPCIFPSGPE